MFILKFISSIQIETIGCAGSDSQSGSKTSSTTNPLLSEWDTPFGVPPFDAIKDDHYLPAFRAAMAEQKDEIGVIVDSSEPATFANTIEALDGSGELLDKVSGVFFNQTSAETNDELEEVSKESAPLLSAARMI